MAERLGSKTTSFTLLRETCRFHSSPHADPLLQLCKLPPWLQFSKYQSITISNAIDITDLQTSKVVITAHNVARNTDLMHVEGTNVQVIQGITLHLYKNSIATNKFTVNFVLFNKTHTIIATVFTIGRSSLRLNAGVLHVLGWRGRATREHLKLRVVQLCVRVCVCVCVCVCV